MTAPITRLVSVGNVVIDIVTPIAALPDRGGDVFAHHASVSPGGGFNLLVAARRQLLPATFAGTLGTGPFGAIARAALEAQGITIALAPLPEVDTGFSVVMVDDAGERTFVTSRGAEALLNSELLDRVPLAAGDAVAVSGYGLLHPTNRVAILRRLARLDAETTVFYDPGPLGHQIAEIDAAAIAARADWFSCNEREAAQLTGYADPARAAVAIARTLERGGVLVRLGPRGCLLIEPGGSAPRGGEPRLIGGYPVRAIDTNGAGDAHAGAFLAALAHGADPASAVDRANAVAAIAVTRRGPGSAPLAAEVDAFLAARGG